jgi:hypothetical protein
VTADAHVGCAEELAQLPDRVGRRGLENHRRFHQSERSEPDGDRGGSATQLVSRLDEPLEVAAVGWPDADVVDCEVEPATVDRFEVCALEVGPQPLHQARQPGRSTQRRVPLQARRVAVPVRFGRGPVIADPFGHECPRSFQRGPTETRAACV